MKIGVIGTGYVGLIQAVGLAHLGFKVVAYDIDSSKIEILKKGTPPIYEKGLKELLHQNRERIIFTSSVEDLKGSEVVFVCVGTPQDAKGKANLNFVFSAIESLKPLLTGKEIVVLKSTVPVGTNRKVQKFVGNKAFVVSNPEFLREGIAVDDFFNPERVVLGFGENHPKWVMEKMLKIYEYFLKKEVPFVVTNWESAELIKYASNTFLAMKISFINELARLSEKVGADIKDVAKGMGLDSRIGNKFLNAGIGWGGSCFPKDVSALIWQFKEWEIEPKLPKATKEINEEQILWFLNKIRKHYGGNLSGTFALLGLAFKPYTDDLRESPSLKLAEMLIEEGAFVKGYDYIEGARKNVKKLVEVKTSTRYSYGLIVCDELKTAVEGVDGVIIAVEYKEWNRENWKEISKLVRNKALFDGRNILKEELIRELIKDGWHYEGVGVKPK
ncbi:MAG: UDP-glucose/GDP-mannose dehydrogenase family protein [Gammaproteobacteria bacterium]|nr:MAG: UDP-glucose/GDP-mannose dehydrogenase family protein [Gammaproteobacteria bacterium]